MFRIGLTDTGRLPTLTPLHGQTIQRCTTPMELAMSQTTVTFLGTATVTPEAGHDTASFLINRNILVDTGWYAAVRMLSYGFSPLDLDYLILTHCHHDHYIGLPHLLFYRRMRRGDRAELPPLKVIGPAEDVQLVTDLARRLLQTERFPDVEHVPVIHPLSPGEAFESEAFRLTTCATVHAVQGLCYRFLDKATGAEFGFTGDTAYHPPIADHLRGCSLIVHEASHGTKEVQNAVDTGHSSARDAARIGAAAGAARLALVHLPPGSAPDAVAAARAVFADTFWPQDGEVVKV